MEIRKWNPNRVKVECLDGINSYKLSSIVPKLRCFSKGKKHVLRVLCDKYPNVFPSGETIAREAGLSSRWVRDQLRELEAEYIIEAVPYKGKLKAGGTKVSTQYKINERKILALLAVEAMLPLPFEAQVRLFELCLWRPNPEAGSANPEVSAANPEVSTPKLGSFDTQTRNSLPRNIEVNREFNKEKNREENTQGETASPFSLYEKVADTAKQPNPAVAVPAMAKPTRSSAEIARLVHLVITEAKKVSTKARISSKDKKALQDEIAASDYTESEIKRHTHSIVEGMDGWALNKCGDSLAVELGPEIDKYREYIAEAAQKEKEHERISDEITRVKQAQVAERLRIIAEEEALIEDDLSAGMDPELLLACEEFRLTAGAPVT